VPATFPCCGANALSVLGVIVTRTTQRSLFLIVELDAFAGDQRYDAVPGFEDKMFTSRGVGSPAES
jgi:hypothetical protein